MSYFFFSRNKECQYSKRENGFFNFHELTLHEENQRKCEYCKNRFFCDDEVNTSALRWGPYNIPKKHSQTFGPDLRNPLFYWKKFRRTKFSADKIFVTSSKLRQFCPTKRTVWVSFVYFGGQSFKRTQFLCGKIIRKYQKHGPGPW